MAQNKANLIDSLTEHTDVESAGDGGNGNVACWLDHNRDRGRDEVKHNLKLLANAHGYEYKRGSFESNGYIIVFEEQ